MPYIVEKDRLHFHKLLEEFDRVSKSKDITAGDMNYLISSMFYRFSNGCNKVSYSKYNEIIGILECAKMEFYRRIITSYEDEKIASNGDVFVEK